MCSLFASDSDKVMSLLACVLAFSPFYIISVLKFVWFYIHFCFFTFILQNHIKKKLKTSQEKVQSTYETKLVKITQRNFLLSSSVTLLVLLF